MRVDVRIVSADAVFARMLAIEFEMQGIRTRVDAVAEGNVWAEVVLLDLDSAMPPDADTYRRMIGFTERAQSLGEGAGRLCSIVLRRPFEMRLLREEVRSLLFGEHKRENPEDETGAEWTVEKSGRVHTPDGRTVSLSPQESVVLRLLLRERGKTVSRGAIAEALGESASNKADVYVCYLRKKLETPKCRLIRTVRGEGYSLMG